MVELDRSLFLFLNSHHNPFFDSVMSVISMKAVWVPLYLLIIYLLFRKYRGKIWIVILMALVMVLIADQLSGLIKGMVERLRPCHEPSLEGLIHTVNGKCGGMYGFVSAHAANTFGLAAFTAPLMKEKGYSWVIFCWALVVSYSRIYLGVHYPGDVIGGIILGSLVGFGVALATLKILKMKR